jgi:hypothetical protein
MVTLHQSTPRASSVSEAAEQRCQGNRHVLIANRLSIKMLLVVNVHNNLVTVHSGKPGQLGGPFGHCY